MLKAISFFAILTKFEIIAVIPTGVIQAPHENIISFCSQSSFGAELAPKSNSNFAKLIIANKYNVFGCEKIVTNLSGNFYWLVERGNCSFSVKMNNAVRGGSIGLMVYNSLRGIYQEKDYASPSDYDCSAGVGYVEKLSYPVWKTAIPTECTQNIKCKSQQCVVTNVSTTAGTKVCCAFDFYITMRAELPSRKNYGSAIAVFLRIQDGLKLLQVSPSEVMIYERPEFPIPFASVLMCILALGIVFFGALATASTENDIVRTITPLGSQYQTSSNDENQFKIGKGEPQNIELPVASTSAVAGYAGATHSSST